MKLQIACDMFELGGAIELVKRVESSIDIIEVGTPLVIGNGLGAVRGLRGAFPDKLILADVKIADGGYQEAAHCFREGASYVTALALADDATLKGCLAAADDFGGRLVVDLLCVVDLAGRVESLERLGVEHVAVHTGVDSQARGRTPLADLQVVRQHVRTMRISVAGGISSRTVNDYLVHRPDVVIVGSAIADADDPSGEAAGIKQAIDHYRPAAGSTT